MPAACFRGQPLPTCKSFWITESSLIASTGQRFKIASDGNSFWSVEIGWMRNLSPKVAVGGGVAAGDSFVSLRPRYRRWVTPKTSVDGIVGVRWEPGRIEILELQVGLSRSDLVGVWTGPVIDFGQSRFAWTGGVKVGSYAGVTTYVLALAGLTYFVLTFDGS